MILHFENVRWILKMCNPRDKNDPVSCNSDFGKGVA